MFGRIVSAGEVERMSHPLEAVRAPQQRRQELMNGFKCFNMLLFPF